MNKTILNWSGGKDATLALHYLLQEDSNTIMSLLTTINKRRRRITMHGVHEDLLMAQVKSLGLPVEVIELPEDISMQAYSDLTQEMSKQHHSQGISHYAYGDINLEDLRRFRDDSLEKAGLKPLYPLWQRDTTSLANEFIALGYKAIVVAISSDKLDSTFVGCEFDHAFLDRLPEGVDPCGENGEFHTFVYDGPIFNEALHINIGETSSHTYNPSTKDKDCFCDEGKQKDWSTQFSFCEITLQNNN